MSSIFGDLRLATRALGRNRGLSALAILTLALGIGANTAIFSVINGVLLEPLPYPDADRLVQVWNTYPLMGLDQASVSVPDYFDRREGVPAFEESALYFFTNFNLAGLDGPPERIVGLRATATLFPLLRAEPYFGRVFTDEDDQPGREKVAVLGWRLFQSRFGGDPAIIGEDVRLGGEPFRVLGVMQESFVWPHPDVQIWTPFAPTPEQRSDDSRGNEFSQMTARLAPGATLEQAQQQIDAIHAANRERFPEAREFWETSGFGGHVLSVRDQLFGDLEPMLALLQGAALLVLLIACANVANLLLTRLYARQKELALRAALGGSRWQLTRQLLAESVLLGLAGGVAGIVVGWVGVKTLGRVGLGSAGELVEVGLDGTVLLFALGLAFSTGLLFGLIPIASIWRTQPAAVLHDGVRSTSGRRANLPRHALVVVEVALTLACLIGAGLLLRTFAKLQNESPGFDRENVLTAQVSLPAAVYGDDDEIVRFFDRALERLRALPGVRSAGLISNAPFSGSSSSGSYAIDGYEPPAAEARPHGLMRIVDEDYFRALGITLLQGRGFEPRDNASTDGVVIVDRTLVDKYWPDADPIGQRISRGGDDAPRFTVIGVVEPVKVQTLDQTIEKETLYFSYRQRPGTRMTFVLKTEVDPETLTQPLRAAILAVDPELPAHNVVTLASQIGDTLQTRRVSMTLLIIFGALAVILAAIGLYGVLAAGVAQRVRELGTRMAMGAAPGDVLRLVLGRGIGLTLVGIVLGVALALALGRFLTSQLYGVVPWDPVTLVATATLLLLVALVACYRPARRATRINPIEALREE